MFVLFSTGPVQRLEHSLPALPKSFRHLQLPVGSLLPWGGGHLRTTLQRVRKRAERRERWHDRNPRRQNKLRVNLHLWQLQSKNTTGRRQLWVKVSTTPTCIWCSAFHAMKNPKSLQTKGGEIRTASTNWARTIAMLEKRERKRNLGRRWPQLGAKAELKVWQLMMEQNKGKEGGCSWGAQILGSCRIGAGEIFLFIYHFFQDLPMEKPAFIAHPEMAMKWMPCWAISEDFDKRQPHCYEPYRDRVRISSPEGPSESDECL